MRFHNAPALIVALLAVPAGAFAAEKEPAKPARRPAALRPGDTVMFVAPAGELNKKRVELAAERLRERGYEVRLPDDLFRQRGYLAGTDEQRADELMRAFTDPEVDAIFPGTGGYGVTRMLDLLDFERIAANPKLLIGFSDITALHLALNKKCGLATVHSPNPQWGLGSDSGMTPLTEEHFWRMVAADEPLELPYEYRYSPKYGPLQVYSDGRGEGPLVGGNLTLVSSVVGTPYEPDTRGKVLFLEDIREQPYRIDRMLRQLQTAGLLEAPAAVILGQFRECDADDYLDEDDDPASMLTLAEVFGDYFADAPYPVVANFPAGHVTDNASLPMGRRFAVDGDRVMLLEQPLIQNTALPGAESAEWSPAFEGVELTSVTLDEPRPLRVQAARVNLTAAGLSVRTDPDNGARPEETDGLRTSSFLRKFDCQLAINGGPFWPAQDEDGGPQNAVGLIVCDGELVSPVDDYKPRPALVFRDGVASVETPPIALEGIDVAVGGFSVILREGRVLDDGTTALHPRTAAGIANDGRTLLLVTVDGRQPGYSEGVTTVELGRLLKGLGAVDGINLDGGGTTSMVVADGSESRGFRLVNRPIHGGVPGQERVSASHLGVYADPLRD